MENTNCRYKIDCTVVAIVAALIVGIITTFLTISAVIIVTPIFYWVVFGIANVYLALTFLSKRNNRTDLNECTCLAFPAFLAGALGSIATSLILLAVGFAVTSIIGAIFTGILLFFFTLLLVSVVCLAKCNYRCCNETNK